jgi:predicted DNA-binding ribbon-helix-helix protein
MSLQCRTVAFILMHGPRKPSLNLKRNAVVGRHKTSVYLEETFWKALHEIAAANNIALSDLLLTLDTERHHGNLSSAIRVFVLEHYRSQPILIDPTA